jgi:3-(3-hydroxy-phenyl)propionate hydroxylase
MTPEDAEIERAVIYTFHSVLAEGWRRDRLLLAGDAAHQTPPFLGQGMCAALRDASNLAWKLAAVLRGRADENLLDTYESERAPHVHAFIALAVRLGDIIQTTDPGQARERDARFKAGQPEIFQFPSPRLGPGVWWGDSAPVGQPFPQPLLDDGNLLDAHLGIRMAVIGDPAAIDAVSQTTRATWERWNTCVIRATDSALRAWLETQGAAAVMLRPDRYILGIAHSATGLDALAAGLPSGPAKSADPR